MTALTAIAVIGPEAVNTSSIRKLNADTSSITAISARGENATFACAAFLLRIENRGNLNPDRCCSRSLRRVFRTSSWALPSSSSASRRFMRLFDRIELPNAIK